MNKDDGKGEEERHQQKPEKAAPPGPGGGQNTAATKDPQHEETQSALQVEQPKEPPLQAFWRTFRRNANAALAVSTAALVVVTIISNWVLIGDQRTADIAGLRPYLVYDKHTISPTGANTLTDMLLWHNAGKTPAISVVGRIGFSTFSPFDRRSLSQRIDHALDAMAALTADTKNVDAAIGPGSPGRTTDKGMTFFHVEMLNMAISEGWVLVGEITYTDTFRGYDVSEYCVYGTGGDFKNYEFCPTHNGLR